MNVQTTLRILRERAGLSQGELAEAVGVQQPRLSQWEAGVIPIPAPRAERLALVIGAQLGAEYARLAAADLDRPWDDVLRGWDKADRADRRRRADRAFLDRAELR